MLLYYSRAVDEVSGAAQRLTATIIGIALAIGGMALVALRSRPVATRDASPNHR